MNLGTLLSAIFFYVSIVSVLILPTQSEFYFAFTLYSLAFGSFVLFLKSLDSKRLWMGVLLGFLVRFTLLFFFPNLSDDIYRFYWDGLLWHDGINPLMDTPTQLMKGNLLESDIYDKLYLQLNSKDYFTVYPPICQFFFWAAANFSNILNASIFIKCIFLLADICTYFGLVKLLNHFKISSKFALIYFLNPLIITEFVGNLHFESLMICALIWCLYFLAQGKSAIGGLFYGIAILVKLIPLMFGPILLAYTYKRKNWKSFFSVAGLMFLMGFSIQFYGVEVSHFASSLDLYFRSFEFNASVYYGLRQLGQWFSGYNQISILGPFLGVVTLGLILKISIDYADTIRDVVKGMSIIIFLYLIFATTVHPWYISTFLVLAVFNKRFLLGAIVWSYLVFLSYSAYDTVITQEHLWALVLEYGLVFLILKMGISSNNLISSE